MSKVQIKSIFEQIAEWAFTLADLNQVKQDTIAFVQSKQINEKDKQSIIKNVSECKTLTRFHTYIANSLLKYEGLGMNQLEKPKL
jgi:hypothetical protein